MTYKTLISFVGVLGISIIFSGCSLKAPEFKSNNNTVAKIKAMKLQPMSINYDIRQNSIDKPVKLRLVEMSSPINNSYEDYLNNALEITLKNSGIYTPNSNIQISAELTKNEIHTGIPVGTADIGAKFIVYEQGKIHYEKEHQIHDEWNSSIIGDYAIHAAANNYPKAINKLIESFLTDTNLTKLYTISSSEAIDDESQSNSKPVKAENGVWKEIKY